MKLFPAIDIKDGKCVRLKQGLFNEVTVYSEHPYEIAMEFERDGADYIHLVDLDGSLKGRSVNANAIREIVSHVNIPVELGGGIRTIENIRETLSLGVDRVIIGTKACENPEFVREAIDTFGPDKIVVGIDAKDGLVAIKGWEELSDTTALSLAIKMKEMGVKTIIYTDISKDGMLVGPNIEKTKELSEASGLCVVASGGMSSIDDLIKLDNENIYGAIIGKAIYEKRIILKDAVAYFKKPKFSFADFKLNSDGLIPVVVTDYENNQVLMLAYMNEEAYNLTVSTGVMTYFSRSRQSLWKKGETSGHFQYVKSIDIDCDNDTLLAKVLQVGAACHTGNRSCFYRNIIKNN